MKIQRQPHLRAPSRAAQDIQLRPDAFRPIAHPRKSQRDMAARPLFFGRLPHARPLVRHDDDKALAFHLGGYSHASADAADTWVHANVRAPGSNSAAATTPISPPSSHCAADAIAGGGSASLRDA